MVNDFRDFTKMFIVDMLHIKRFMKYPSCCEHEIIEETFWVPSSCITGSCALLMKLQYKKSYTDMF